MKTSVARKIRLDKILWVEDNKNGKIMPIVLGNNKTSYLDILNNKVYKNIEFDEEDDRLDLVEEALYKNLGLDENEMHLTETSSMLGREYIARPEGLKNSKSSFLKYFYSKMYLWDYSVTATNTCDNSFPSHTTYNIGSFCEFNYASKKDIMDMQKYFQKQMDIRLNRDVELEK